MYGLFMGGSQIQLERIIFCGNIPRLPHIPHIRNVIVFMHEKIYNYVCKITLLYIMR